MIDYGLKRRNMMRLACLGKSNGQSFTLSPKGLFFMRHILLAINQISLPKIWKCVKFVYTHILTGISSALIYLFSKRYARTGTLFSGVFRPFPYSYVLFLSTFKLNDV